MAQKKKISIVDPDVECLRLYQAILQRNYDLRTFKAQGMFMRDLIFKDEDDLWIPQLIIFEKDLLNGFNYTGCRYYLGYKENPILKDIPRIIITDRCPTRKCIWSGYSDGCYDKSVALTQNGILESIVEKHIK